VNSNLVCNSDYDPVYICKNCQSFLFRFQDLEEIKSSKLEFYDREINIFSDGDLIQCDKCGTEVGVKSGGIELYVNKITEVDNKIFSEYFQEAIFAAGCFWGVEYHYKRLKGVIYTTVGYTGGEKSYPTYEEVKKGNTGHKEAVHILFDPEIITYEELIKVFFEIHDFTQMDGQGTDIGSQYLSYIFYIDQIQRKTAELYIKILREMGYKVATRLEKATRFWKAEDYHQDYYDIRNEKPYCHIRRKIF